MKISIVLPAYNAEAHLAEALDSVLDQTEPDFEIVAIDDGSTDSTARLIDQAALADRRVKPIHTSHQGLVAALNRGLAEAQGEYVARMDADDIAYPNRLRVQHEILERRPELGLIGCRVDYLGDPQRNRGLALFVEWTNSLVEPEAISLGRFVESPLIHPSVMFRRELVGRYGGYRDGPFPEDYELWLRWLEAGVGMAKTGQALLGWRDRPARLTRTDPRYSVDAFFGAKAPYLERWLASNNRHHPETIIWGAGRTSRLRLRFLTDLGVRVRAFVDIDPKKIGQRIGDVAVLAAEDLPSPDECFVLGWVASRGARARITGVLRAGGFTLGRNFLLAA